MTREERKMLSRIFGNWQTTLAGVFAAAVQAYLGGMSIKSVLASLPTLLIGMLAKDAATGSAPAAGTK